MSTLALFDDPTVAMDEWDAAAAAGDAVAVAIQRNWRADVRARARAEESQAQLTRLVEALETALAARGEIESPSWAPVWLAVACGARLDARDAATGVTALECAVARGSRGKGEAQGKTQRLVRALVALRALFVSARAANEASDAASGRAVGGRAVGASAVLGSGSETDAEQRRAAMIKKATAWAGATKGRSVPTASRLTAEELLAVRQEAGRQLAAALASGSLEVADALALAFPSGPEALDARAGGDRALRHAAAAGSKEWTGFLLDLGADPRSQDGTGRNARDIALSFGHKALARDLAETIARCDAPS